MSNCPNCGNELQEGTAFCPVCGAEITEKAQEKHAKGASDEFMQQFPSYQTASEQQASKKEEKGKKALKMVLRLVVTGILLALISTAASVWIPRACASSKPEEKTVLTMSELGEGYICRETMTLYHRGDIVHRLEEEYTYVIASGEYTDPEFVQGLMDAIQEACEADVSALSEYDFITCSFSTDENTLTEKIIIEKMDQKKNIKVLEEMGMLESDGSGLISYEGSVNALQEIGYTIQKQ